MGSYAQCWLGPLYVGSTKNDVDSTLINLYRASDKRVVSDPTDGLPNQLQRWASDLSNDPDLSLVFYSAPVRIIRDRLNLFGYTLESARTSFEEHLKREIQFCEDSSEERYQEFTKPKLAVLRSLTVESWSSTLKEMFAQGIKPNEYGRFDVPRDESTLKGYMLCNDWYGFPGEDVQSLLRIVLEIVPDADELVYDVTDLVCSGYFELDDDLVEFGIHSTAEGYLSLAKTIVLTEGRTDSWILSETMAFLYPHLCDYFSFMDFEGFRPAGGAGNLGNLVKAFAGAQVANRTIALFDNDTAANAALRTLKADNLPANISVVQLPNLDLLDDYPTLGPTGMVRTNVNGIASSIELFLGQDVLVHKEYGFHPVQWTGFDTAIRQYQGEVIEKAELHKRYRKKLEKARQASGPSGEQDWSGMHALLEHLFSTFHRIDQENIRSWARGYLSE